jgi:hypothetical protein
MDSVTTLFSAGFGPTVLSELHTHRFVPLSFAQVFSMIILGQ